ncbi:MAG: N-acetylmuramoyl-L-alanine amidase [Cohnella sp.]|uniref:N-acetylmuramoyl-L-alanine amidase family protein n=1 Tax=Cohnella sp. TaxID=1883426 RepID=UPI000E3AA898|nr:N-acetylmuramoyl-L-alanine amidase family protein [Cohnella sp.]REK67307.1 MAG: N-acetylmuramoyl-L-alanine amidase [Cohnella sp.]
MKNWTSLLFAAIVMLFLSAGVVSAQSVTPKLILDGKVLNPPEPPQIIGNFTMVPVRIVTENLGYTVDYNKSTKQITVKNGTSVVVMTLDKKTATVDGVERTMLAAPTAKSETTLIPLRFTGEAFGLQVYWDNTAKAAFLYSNKSSGGSTDENSGDTPPKGGGTVGVVEPGDGTGTGGNGETGGGATDGSGSGGAANPRLLGTVSEVKFENDTVIFTYDGIIQPLTSTLTGPDRIVIDMPNAGFASDFVPGFSADSKTQTGELAVTGHEALQKIRYSLFSNNPSTLRFVLDLKQAWGYKLTNDLDAHQLRIALAPLSAGSPSGLGKNVYTIVLDAGHGGSDPGAISITKKKEKDFNLAVILKLRDLLAADPRLKVVLTRSDDSYPTLADRANLANSLKADLFLSVHANSSTSSSANGSETYYTRDASKAFAETVHKYAVSATGLKDNGVRKSSLYVTRETTMPAVLYEAGYLSNASDESKLYTEAFQNKLAQGLATAIKVYLNLT